MPEDKNLLTGPDDTDTPAAGQEPGGQDKQDLADNLSVDDDTNKQADDADDKKVDDGKEDQQQDNDKDDADDKEPEVPEKYEIKLPEGIEMDEAAMEVFEPLFKEHKLTNEQAQKFADAYIELRKNEMKAYSEQIEKWKSEAKNDPEYGGRQLKENLAVAQKAMNEVFSEKTIALLDSVGFTSHPELIRDLVKLGKRMSDDTWVDGAGSKKGGDDSHLTPEQKLARMYKTT